MRNLTVNGERLWASLMELAQIGATPKGGVCRLALTDLDRQGRDLVVRWLRDAGATVEIDGAGNIFAIRRGRTDAPPVLTGSHVDTQPSGGKFDGNYGVLAGLEVLRTLNDARLETEKPVGVAIWTNEEGTRFIPTMGGSGAFARVFTLEYLLAQRDIDGISFGDALHAIGYAGTTPVGWVSRWLPAMTGARSGLRPGRRAKMLPIRSTVTVQPAASHQPIKRRRAAPSRSLAASRHTPPFSVAPIRASSITLPHSRSPFTVRLRIGFAQKLERRVKDSGTDMIAS